MLKLVKLLYLHTHFRQDG